MWEDVGCNSLRFNYVIALYEVWLFQMVNYCLLTRRVHPDSGQASLSLFFAAFVSELTRVYEILDGWRSATNQRVTTLWSFLSFSSMSLSAHRSAFAKSRSISEVLPLSMQLTGHTVICNTKPAAVDTVNCTGYMLFLSRVYRINRHKFANWLMCLCTEAEK